MNSEATFVEDLESLLESFEDYEWDEAEDFDEAAKTKSRLRPMKSPVGKAKSAYQPRPSQYVTQTQLQATSTRLEARIGALSKETVQQVNNVKKEQAKQIAALKKEVAIRKKETDTFRKELRQLRDMSALLPLISRPSSQTLTAAAGGLPAGTKVLVDKNDTMSMLMPMLLLGGLGGSSGSGGLGGGESGDNSMMMMVLLLSMSNR